MRTRMTLRIAPALALIGLLIASVGMAADGVVNINTAEVEELTLLPRVGPTVAQRIVDHRGANGPFSSIEDLLLVQGIGEKTFELIRPYVALEGETTLQEKVRASSEGDEPR